VPGFHTSACKAVVGISDPGKWG